MELPCQSSQLHSALSEIVSLVLYVVEIQLSNECIFRRGSQGIMPTLVISFYMTNIPVFLPFLSNNEKREELEHDLQAEITKLEEWKSHIIRFIHQDAAKTAAVDALSKTEALLIMDWAMKFLPTSYRETQRDWFGKKGKPWHITVAITKADNEEIEVRLMLKSCLSHFLPSFKRYKTQY